MVKTDKGVAAAYAERLAQEFEREMTEKRWVGSARWNNPSQIGHPCERFLVLRRTKGALQKAPSPALQARFEIGTALGKLEVARLLQRGWEIRQIEATQEWPQYQISGRPDLEARPPGERQYVPIEVKSVHPALMAGIRTLDDLLSHQNWRVRMWPSQLIIYELLAGYEEGILDLISTAGWRQFIPVPLDYGHAEALVAKCERVNAHVAAGTEPEPINDPDVCPGCSFFMTEACSPSLSLAPDIGVVEDEEVIADVRRLLELKPLAAEYEALRKSLAQRFTGVNQALVPDVAIVTGKEVVRQIKPQPAREERFWQVKYLPLQAVSEEEP